MYQGTLRAMTKPTRALNGPMDHRKALVATSLTVKLSIAAVRHQHAHPSTRSHEIGEMVAIYWHEIATAHICEESER